MSQRSKTDPTVLASQFYGGKVCVVTGRYETVDWHHLDEVHKNHTFANIIPLQSLLNQSIERTRVDVDRPGEPELQDNVLYERAYRLYKEGLVRRSYACYRLGSFLTGPRSMARTSRRWDPNRSLEHAAWAITCLRQVSSALAVNLLGDTLERSILSTLKLPETTGRVSARTVALLAIEMGAVLRDFGAPEHAIRWCDLATRVTAGLDSTDVTRIRVVQHRGLALISLDPEWVLAELPLLIESSPEPAVRSTTALWVARARAKASGIRATRKDLNRLSRLALDVHDVESLMPGRLIGELTWGTFAELLLSKADYLRDVGDPTWWDVVSQARKVFQRFGGAPAGNWSSVALDEFEHRYITFLPDRLSRRDPMQITRLRRLMNEIFPLLARSTTSP
jgi:hypothetical protein